jgi:hypothetical protein
MASHDVTLKRAKAEIVNSDFVFEIKKNSKKLGELHISRGAIEWVPNNARYKRRMSWTKFDSIMSDARVIK